MATTIERPADSAVAGKFKLVPFDETVYQVLRDPEGAEAYLCDALEDNVEEFLDAIKLLLKANGGIRLAAEKTGLARESLYPMLSDQGNPSFRTLKTILEAYGFEFSVRRTGGAGN